MCVGVCVCVCVFQGGWVDVGGSIVRRIFSIDYKFKVTDPDPNLGAKIEANMGNIILKEHMAYKSLCSFSEGQSVWKILPQYFIDNQKRTAVSTNPIMAYVTTSSQVYFNPHNHELYMAMGEFVAHLKSYCKDNGVSKTSVWAVNAVETNLQAQGCDIMSVREAIMYKRINLDQDFAMQVPIDEKVIFGVCLRPTFDSHTQSVEEARLAAQSQDVDEDDPERRQDELDRGVFDKNVENAISLVKHDSASLSVPGQPSAPDDSDNNRAVWLHRELKPQSTSTLFKLGGKDEVVLNEFAGFFSKLPPPKRNHFIDRPDAGALAPHMAKLARRYHLEAHQ